jgi:serine/threonine protein kinase
MRCNDSRLNVVLYDNEDSVEFRAASNHVESCSKCQQRLIELSGDQSLLQEVRETLQGCDETEPFHSVAPSSVVISIDGNSDDDMGAECEPVSLDFLSPPSHPEMLGRIGRYEVERMIGSGGMGIVLKGFDTELHRVVAIKVLKSHLAHNGAARRRFAREAQSAAAVVHEHVIPIHDVLTDGDTPYLVMQYVPGQSLQARVDERGPLDAKEVLRIARQAAAGLGAAHAQGVVHRDVKPANILLEESVERVLISDFGLARTVDDATLTRTGVVAGTPHYMSPEQAIGQPVDHRSDLFSLGSSIYFMCTGRPPFRAEHALAILNRICNDQHRPVDEVNSDLPAELAEIVDRLLSKNPADRFRDAQEVERQLDAILVQLQSGQRSRRVRWRRTWLRWRTVIRKSAMAAGVIGICVLIGFGLAFWNMPPVPSPKADSIPPVARVEQPKTASPSIITLPPDTFAQDLAETQQLLEEISAHWNTTQQVGEQSGSESNRWSEQISEIVEHKSFNGEP